MAAFVREAYEFGFTHFELNSILTPRTLAELLAIDGIRISSVHCPCPVITLSDGKLSTHPQLSSLEKETRSLAIEFAKQTIALSTKIGARAVIIHAGVADVDFYLERDMHTLYRKGKVSSDEFREVQQKLITERSKKAQPYVEAAFESIRELLVCASENSILLGLENRVHYSEIPSFKEMQQLLMGFQGQPIGYWHDVGHAEILARLGFTPHRDWLSYFRDEMIGIHLHDVDVLRDHCAPGIGTVDWDMVAQNIPENAIRVCEIGEWNKKKDIAQSVSFLMEKGIIGDYLPAHPPRYVSEASPPQPPSQA